MFSKFQNIFITLSFLLIYFSKLFVIDGLIENIVFR